MSSLFRVTLSSKKEMLRVLGGILGLQRPCHAMNYQNKVRCVLLHQHIIPIKPHPFEW